MGIIKLLLWGRPAPSRRQPVRVKRPATQAGTPIHSVRRKFLLGGTEHAVTLKPDATRNSLVIKEDTFIISLRPATRENFEQFMENWYRRQARKSFRNAIERWLLLFHEAGQAIPSPRLKIFAMRRAWGRCYYTKGLITMNLHLVKAPQLCIDYIVLHELCHFVISNHSKDFYRLVESFMPDWREADKLLKTFAREHRLIR